MIDKGGAELSMWVPPVNQKTTNSPELNPDEWVWNHLKNNGVGRQIIHTKPQMKRAVIAHMKRIQKSPDLICSFFQAETTRYAA